MVGISPTEKESIGDIIVNRANVGIGVKETVSKLSLNGGMWIRGKNKVASVNGFQNSLELLTPGSEAIVFQPDTNEEFMFGLH